MEALLSDRDDVIDKAKEIYYHHISISNIAQTNHIGPLTSPRTQDVHYENPPKIIKYFDEDDFKMFHFPEAPPTLFKRQKTARSV